MVYDLLLLCRGIITQSSVGEGFAFFVSRAADLDSCRVLAIATKGRV